MGIVDVERNALVICLAYLGSPSTEVSATLAALAKSLGQRLESCASDDGPPLEWLEYVGGQFEGHQICCQVFGVPPDARARRRALLDSADVVAYLLDATTEPALRAGVDDLRELVDELLAEPRSVPVPIVVHLHHTEGKALELAPVRAALEPLGDAIAISELDARTGSGAREGFVTAVHLATERVRRQVRVRTAPIAAVAAPALPPETRLAARQEVERVRGSLPDPAPSATGSLATHRASASPIEDELEAQLDAALTSSEALEAPRDATPDIAASAKSASQTDVAAAPWFEDRAKVERVDLVEVARAARPRSASTGPRLPDLDVAKNAIWPPLEGRLMLVELAAYPMTVTRTEAGDWEGAGEQWRALSYRADEYDDHEVGRRTLITWAGEHGRLARMLSGRCIVLAATGSGTWRLWQLVRVEPSLRTWLRQAESFDIRALYGRLLRAAAALGELALRCAGTPLEPDVDNVTLGNLGAAYRGWMPPTGRSRPTPVPDEHTIEALVARELARALTDQLSDRRTDLQRSLPALWTGGTTWEAVVTAAVAAAR